MHTHKYIYINMYIHVWVYMCNMYYQILLGEPVFYAVVGCERRSNFAFLLYQHTHNIYIRTNM